MEQARMTQPSRDGEAGPTAQELLAAIVEYIRACNAVSFEKSTWHGYTAPGGPSAPSEYRKAKALDNLDAIARAAVGTGDAGA